MLLKDEAYDLAGDGWEINVVSLLMKEIYRLFLLQQEQEIEKLHDEIWGG